MWHIVAFAKKKKYVQNVGNKIMKSTVAILPSNLKDISSELLLENGKLKLFSHSVYDTFEWNELRYFCHMYARYGLPTVELIECLKKIISGRSAIEIGSGHGDLGYHLGIPMTDSKIQNKPFIRESYKAMGQPIIQYPNDVERLEALEAVNKYRPRVVVASWVTAYSPYETTYGSSPYGIREDKLLSQVETYILIGNQDIHGDKPIMQLPHTTIAGNYIRSRAKNPENNRIYIWENSKG